MKNLVVKSGKLLINISAYISMFFIVVIAILAFVMFFTPPTNDVPYPFIIALGVLLIDLLLFIFFIISYFLIYLFVDINDNLAEINFKLSDNNVSRNVEVKHNNIISNDNFDSYTTEQVVSTSAKENKNSTNDFLNKNIYKNF